MTSDTSTQSPSTHGGSEAEAAGQHRFDLRRLDVAQVAKKIVGDAARAVRVATLIFAGFLVAHVVLVVTQANPVHPVTVFIRTTAEGLSLGLDQLFLPSSPTLALIVNLGLAAVAWIVIGVVVAKLLELASSMLDS